MVLHQMSCASGRVADGQDQAQHTSVHLLPIGQLALEPEQLCVV
ncbi:MAG: hypothetical protein ACRCZG_01055 [Culicoidibacterales bacterium]